MVIRSAFESIIKFWGKIKTKQHSIFLAIVIALVTLLFVKAVYWLAIALSVVFLLYFFLRKWGIIRWFKTKRVLNYLILFLLVIMLSITLRVFFLQIFTIPSNSMQATIISGDKVLASKLTYGPRLPSSPFEIPWVNIALFFNKKARLKANDTWWNYKRMNGHSHIKHNDVVLLDHPDKRYKIVLIKRCVGLPGDTLLIKKSTLYINSTEQSLPTDAIIYNNQLQYMDASFISADTTLKLYPWHKSVNWTLDDFGPLVIPYKGMQIELNDENVIRYSKQITCDGKIKIEFKHGNWYLDGVLKNTYVFENDYYFMLGDNRNQSIDSREYGFVPDMNIIGKAWLILFSADEYGFKWNRIVKTIQ